MSKLFKKNKVIRLAGLLAVVSSGAVAATVRVPAKDFPLAYDVDVLVVGGTSGGAAAAVKAAQSGSRVFLMAQRPYLGEDICGAYRLWVDRSDRPLSGLAEKVFQSPVVMTAKPVSYEYEADAPSQAPHLDTAKPSRLKDGKKHDMQRETIQYNSAVNIIAVLPEAMEVERIDLSTFQFPGSFGIQSVAVYVSNDKKKWESVGKEEDTAFAKGAKNFSVPVQRKARFIKIAVEPRVKHTRILLSELEILKATASTLKAGDQYPPTPLHVKRTLDNAMLEAGVEFLYGCYPTDLLTDSKGAVRGVIMANRAGRQVVRAKTIIDATPTALLARLAGASMRPEGSTPVFKYTAIVPVPAKTVGVTVTATPVKMYDKGEEYSAFEYTVPVKAGPLDIHSYAKAQQQVFDKVWAPGALSVSEYAFAVPETSIVSAGRYEGDGLAEKIPATAFQSLQLPGVFILSGYADVSRECAEKLLRPVNYMQTGERIGLLAAEAAKQIPAAKELTAFSKPAGETVNAELKESLSGVRPEHAVKERVKIGDTSYPVLGEYDVVVVGGGTSGGPATIGAARRGAKTLVIEYQHAFGGVGTVGLIGRYWKGYQEGFTKEMDAGVKALDPAGAKPPAGGWDVLDKMEWYRREMRKAGAEMWMCSMAWGAVVKDGDVQGVAVSTPFGPGIVLAKVVVDSTGNGDIAIPAGAKYEYYGPSRISVQGTGLAPVFNIGDSYNNTDFTVSYESDAVDTWHLRVYGKSAGRAGDAYDVSSLVNSRERRRVLGDFYLTVPDQLMQRTYPDSIYKAFSDFDCHGVNYSSYFFLQPNPESTSCYVPYRCLLPKGLNGILTTGMGISINNDALPLVRMQPDLQNQGYAAGVAAAMASEAGIEPRNIDIKKLQQHLVEIGSLPEEVLTAKDVPLPAERILQAVDAAPAEYGEHRGLECSILLAHKEVALPLLRAVYGKADGKSKLFYAHILAVLEDPTGLDTLIEQVNLGKWDKGHPRPTAKMSDLDRLIVSLGLPKDRRATDALVQKINLLTPSSEYSHFRAVAIALDLLKDPAAAPALAALLGKPGMTGYAVHTVEEAMKQDQTAMKNLGAQARFVFSFETRTVSMRELALARALYRCGDYHGVGKKILEEYSSDLRGVLSAHALAVLAEKP